MCQHLIGDKARALGIDVAVARAALVMREESAAGPSGEVGPWLSSWRHREAAVLPQFPVSSR